MLKDYFGIELEKHFPSEALVLWDRDIPQELIGDDGIRVYDLPKRIHIGPMGNPNAVAAWLRHEQRWEVFTIYRESATDDCVDLVCRNGHRHRLLPPSGRCPDCPCLCCLCI